MNVVRVNPVAKLLAALVLAVVLLLSLDWVSAVVALACEIPLFPWAGVGFRRLVFRSLPLIVAALLAGATIALYGTVSGAVYARFLFATVSHGSLELALATTLRILAIGLPALVLFLTVDPTNLGDGLAQVLHLPARFVLGSLAAVRLAGLFVEDWRALELARRARGVADRGRLRRFVGQAFALLVLSIRRGSKLATAMEARGFGGKTPRTWARESKFGAAEFALVGAAVVVAVVAMLVSLGTGHWQL